MKQELLDSHDSTTESCDGCRIPSPATAAASSYPGGKAQAGTFQTIINQIPPHGTFIEAFLGDGALTRNKLPARTTIGVDTNERMLHTRWRGDEVPNLRLLHADALAFLRSYDVRGNEFVYCDPPYLFDIRATRRRGLYDYEFGEIDQHRELLSLLRTLPCMVAINGYWSALYEMELAGWRTITYKAVTRGGTVATEWLWMNYPEPLELHDYRYLGRNYREREKFKKQQRRWKYRLQNMPALQRYAMFAALEEVQRADATPKRPASLQLAIAATTAENNDTPA